jgi:putative transposase
LAGKQAAFEKGELSWMVEVSECVPQEALPDLDKALANFFRRVKEKKSGKNVKVGFPGFKSRKHGLGSFRLTGAIHVFEKAMQLPRLGQLHLKARGYLPGGGVHILNETVSERAGGWLVSRQVEMQISDPVMEEKPVAGLDLGINHMAPVRDGTYFENPRALKKSPAQLGILQATAIRQSGGCWSGSAADKPCLHR